MKMSISKKKKKKTFHQLLASDWESVLIQTATVKVFVCLFQSNSVLQSSPRESERSCWNVLNQGSRWKTPILHGQKAQQDLMELVFNQRVCLVFLILTKIRIMKKRKSETDVEHIFDSVKSASSQQRRDCKESYLFFLSLSQTWSGESITEPSQVSAQFCHI